MKDVKVKTKIIASGLFILLLIGSLIIGSIALNGAKPISAKKSVVAADMQIVGEIESMRSENTKVFYRKDGVNVAVSTFTPIHYKDTKGNWKDIDNSLSVTKGSDGQDYVTNAKNGYKVMLPVEMDSDKAVSVQKGNDTISFKLLGKVNKKASAIKNNQLTDSQKSGQDVKEKSLSMEKKNSSLEYNDVMDDANIKYNVEPNQVKEWIIIKKAPKKQVKYEYEINAGDLTGTLKADKSIIFTNAGSNEAVFTLPAPYMVDSSKKPVASNDIEVTLKQLSKGKYKLTYAPSQTWLADSARTYPVNLDPTIETIDTNLNCHGYVNSELPGIQRVIGNPYYISNGYAGGNGANCIALYSFDRPFPVGQSSIINKVTFRTPYLLDDKGTALTPTTTEESTTASETTTSEVTTDTQTGTTVETTTTTEPTTTTTEATTTTTAGTTTTEPTTTTTNEDCALSAYRLQTMPTQYSDVFNNNISSHPISTWKYEEDADVVDGRDYMSFDLTSLMNDAYTTVSIPMTMLEICLLKPHTVFAH